MEYQLDGGAYSGEHPEDERNCIWEHQEGGGTILGLITKVERSTLRVLSRWWDCKGEYRVSEENCYLAHQVDGGA